MHLRFGENADVAPNTRAMTHGSVPAPGAETPTCSSCWFQSPSTSGLTAVADPRFTHASLTDWWHLVLTAFTYTEY